MKTPTTRFLAAAVIAAALIATVAIARTAHTHVAAAGAEPAPRAAMGAAARSLSGKRRFPIR